jgi:hypothetical protein
VRHSKIAALMSEMGQKLPIGSVRAMSAYPSKATVTVTCQNGRRAPKPEAIAVLVRNGQFAADVG